MVHPGSRPAQGTRNVTIAGGQCRVVALAAGGNVLVDELVASAAGAGPTVVELPFKTERVVLAAPGELSAVGGTLDGWYRGQSLPLIGWDMALAAGSIVRFESHKVADNSQRSNGGWANTRELGRAEQVVTRFDRPVQSIAVAIDDLAGLDAASAVEMHLIGAERIAGADGELVDPIVLVQGLRSVLVYGVTPVHDDAVFDPNVTVVVEHCRSGQLAGVAASLGTVEQLVQNLSLAGFDAAIAAALPGGTGTRTVTWVAAQTPDPGPIKARRPEEGTRRRNAATPSSSSRRSLTCPKRASSSCTRRPARSCPPGPTCWPPITSCAPHRRTTRRVIWPSTAPTSPSRSSRLGTRSHPTRSCRRSRRQRRSATGANAFHRSSSSGAPSRGSATPTPSTHGSATTPRRALRTWRWWCWPKARPPSAATPRSPSA